MLVLGIVAAVVMITLFVGLYVWTRRSERDIEIPPRTLTAEEQQTGVVQRAAAGTIMGGGFT